MAKKAHTVRLTQVQMRYSDEVFGHGSITDPGCKVVCLEYYQGQLIKKISIE